MILSGGTDKPGFTYITLERKPQIRNIYIQLEIVSSLWINKLRLFPHIQLDLLVLSHV